MSHQIRLLDIKLRAEVLSNFLETLKGISHICAFGWESQSVDQNIKNLDVSQGPYYMMLSIQQWLTLVLDIHNLKPHLGQSRIKTLKETLLPEDKGSEDFKPSPQWPDKGANESKDVVAAYNPETIALKDISMKISPGQRVGICGRTGSGKSTLLLSILRLIELESGSITLDGLDLRTLPREKIRARLIAIPQDTFVLNDSIRLNVDPSGLVPDERIITALEKAQLWHVIKSRGSNTAAPSGTATPITNEETANGASTSTARKEVDPLGAPLKDSPLSHGQFQLFGLARALLLKDRSRILILDEATSNMDAKTDEFMQRIIREEFSKHTILMIADQLNTVRDADTIIVMDKGRVVEVDAPDELLAKKVEKKGTNGGEEEEEEKEEAEEDQEGRDKAWYREMWDRAH